MRVVISSYPDDNDDPYLASTLHTDDLAVVFVDTAAGYTDRATASSWAQSVLVALGKDVELPGSRAHASDDLNDLPLWLSAHRTRWVVLPDAHLASSRARSHLLAAIAAGGSNLLLITRPRRYAETTEIYGGWQPEPVPWDSLPEFLPHGTAQPRPRTVTRLRLPTSDWTTFRWDARRIMDDEDFARLDRCYTQAFHATLQRLRRSGETNPSRAQTRRLLGEVTDGMSTVEDMIIAVRAVQAAHFARGFNLRIQSRTMLANLSHSADAKLDDRDWMALRVFQDPVRAATCALRAAGMRLADISGLDVGNARRICGRGALEAAEVRGTSSTAGPGTASVPDVGDAAVDPYSTLDTRCLPALRAAVLKRTMAGAEDDDLLVPHPPVWISRCLNRAWADTGVRVGVGSSARMHSTTGPWQYTGGFTCQGIRS